MSHFLDALTNTEVSKVWLHASKNGDALLLSWQLETISRFMLPAQPICPCGIQPTRSKVTGVGSFTWEKNRDEKQ